MKESYFEIQIKTWHRTPNARPGTPKHQHFLSFFFNWWIWIWIAIWVGTYFWGEPNLLYLLVPLGLVASVEPSSKSIYPTISALELPQEVFNANPTPRSFTRM